MKNRLTTMASTIIASSALLIGGCDRGPETPEQIRYQAIKTAEKRYPPDAENRFDRVALQTAYLLQERGLSECGILEEKGAVDSEEIKNTILALQDQMTYIKKVTGLEPVIAINCDKKPT